MIPAIGTITNSTWGYYITSSTGYSIPSNIPTWINTDSNGAWSPARQAPNGHSYAFPLCSPCPIKIYSGSVNYSSSNFSPISQIQFITTSIAGNELFLPTPLVTNTANYEKFYAPVLAQDGCFYAFDYCFVSASISPVIRETSNVGKIMKLDPSVDRYTTYSFSFPTTTGTSGVRMSSTILGRDGWIYGIPNGVSANNNNNRIFRFHPNDPTTVQSSSILGTTVNINLVGQYLGTLSSRPGAIYWVPRAPSLTKTLAIVLTSSQFSPGTANGISTISLPADLTSTTNDLAYWPSKGHENTGYTYWAPRIGGTPNATLQAKALVLDPYGGTAGTGSFTLDADTNIYNNNNNTINNFVFGFARSFNGDLFSLPYTSHTTSISIDSVGNGSTSNFYPINNSISTQYLMLYPNLMRNGINICPNVINMTKAIFPSTQWLHFMSVKGYYGGVTNFVEQSSYTPPSNINSITSSLYNWLENNTSGN